MTAEDAINIAERKAQALNLPWSRVQVRAEHRRLWPFPGNWRVVARVPGEGAITTILVSARTGHAHPKNIQYPAEGIP